MVVTTQLLDTYMILPCQAYRH